MATTNRAKHVFYGMCKRINHSQSDFAETVGINQLRNDAGEIKDARIAKNISLIRGTLGSTCGNLELKRSLWGGDEDKKENPETELSPLFNDLELGTIVKITVEILGKGRDINASMPGKKWLKESLIPSE